jgi:hypothetical protein
MLNIPQTIFFTFFEFITLIWSLNTIYTYWIIILYSQIYTIKIIINLKRESKGCWLTPITIVTLEAKIKRIMVQDHPKESSRDTISMEKKAGHGGLHL